MRQRAARQHAWVKAPSFALAVALGLAVAVPAQSPDSASSAAPSPDPILARLPANASTVLVLRDLLPPVEALLRMPQVAELLQATAELQEQTFGMSFSGPGLLKQLQLVRDFVPVQAGLGIDAASIDGLVALGRVAWAETLLRAMTGRKVPAATLAAVREQCQNALAKLTAPTGVVLLEVRNERVAESWFDQATGAAQAMAADPAIEVVEGDGTLVVRFDVFALQDGRLRRRLAASGIELPATTSLPLSLRLEQKGTELSLRLGEPAAGPVPPAGLGPRWSPDAAQVFFARFDMTAVALAVAEEAERMAGIAEELPAMRGLAATVEALRLQSEQFSEPTTGSVRIAESVEFVSEMQFADDEGADLVQLPPERLLRCVRPEDGPFQVSAAPLPFLLEGMVDDGRNRLGRKGKSEPLLEALSAGLGEIDGVGGFGFGTVTVSRKAAFRGAPGWQAGAMPFASVAFVGVVEDAEAVATFARELCLRCGDAIDSDGPVFVEKDVGLGVPTHVLRLELLPSPFGAGVDGDWSPHWFLADGVFVLATDVAWSHELLARMRDGNTLSLPTGRIVDWALCRSEHLAACFEGAGKWVAALGQAKMDVEGFMAILAAATRALDRFEWITELDGATFRTRLDVRFAKPAAAGK